MTRRISRRAFMGGLAATTGLAVAGCVTPTDQRAVVASSTGPLRVLNWPDYIDSALLDEVGARLTSRIEYDDLWEDNYTGLDLVIADLEGATAPGWDIIVPTNWLAAQLIQDGYAQRLPLELIPNHVNIDPAFLTSQWDRGARFHMPWQSGITGIAYDPEAVGRELASIEELFAPDLAGRVSMIGEMREAVGLTMLAAGDDPARPTVAAASAALDRLADAEAAGQFHSWVFNDFADLLEAGTVAASMAWSGDVVQLQRRRPDIKFIIPDEGAVQWFDTMMIPTGASNVYAAAQWMNAFYDPEIAAVNTAWVQYISPVLGVRELLAQGSPDLAELAENPLLFPDDDTRRRLVTWAGLDSSADEQALDNRFTEIAGLD